MQHARVCSSRYQRGTRPLVVQRPGSALVCLFDGTSSWSNGTEAATDFATRISAGLAEHSVKLPTIEQIYQLMATCAESTAQNIQPDEHDWEWSFSAAAIRVEGTKLATVSLGGFAIALIGNAGTTTLHRPARVVDAWVRSGRLSEAEARESPHRHLLEGPFFGPTSHRPKLGPAVCLQPGDTVVIGNHCLLDTMAELVPELPTASAIRIRDLIERLGGRSSPTAVWSPIAGQAAPGDDHT